MYTERHKKRQQSEFLKCMKIREPYHSPGCKVRKLFPCSTQLSTQFLLLINVKMPTTVGILTFISMINTTSERILKKTSSFVGILVYMSS